ncbi:MAG TPA: nitrilase-related carbon-nitrogen hydrolase, partial [Planctomycetota bacterium]|nr:nitrilase-related carbon-nitrogen hydrolase [Planctomycetota bacterium]
FLGVQGGQGVDFHLVASNEAWYEESVLMDHMLAFSRLEAIQVGRSVLRATNSGASALFGPDGRLLALLEQDGRHKMVRGTLRVTVPVPKRDADGAAPLTPYVRTRRIQAWAFGILVLACAFLAGKR